MKTNKLNKKKLNIREKYKNQIIEDIKFAEDKKLVLTTRVKNRRKPNHSKFMFEK